MLSSIASTSADLFIKLQLQRDFPYVPQVYIRQVFASRKRFYAPTYAALVEQEENLEQQMRAPGWNEANSNHPYTRRTKPYRPQKRKIGSQVEKLDAEFHREHTWVIQQTTKKDLELAEAMNEKEYEDSGGGIECNCCFSAYPFVSRFLWLAGSY